jgi:hypothetical protein
LKVLISTPPPASSLFPGDQDQRIVKRLLRELFSHSILLQNKKFIELLREANAKNTQAIQVLSDVISGNPIIKSESIKADYTLKDLITYEDDPAFLSAKGRRAQDSEIGESRDNLFARKFGDFLPFATELEIFDPYLLQNLNNSGSGVSWLIDKALKMHKIKLILNTAYPKRQAAPRGMDYQEYCLEAEKSALDSLSKLTHGGQFTGVELRVFSNKNADNHDRFWRMSFYSGSLMVEIPNRGTEVFSDSVVTKVASFYDISDLRRYEMKANSWKGSGKPKALPIPKQF